MTYDGPVLPPPVPDQSEASRRPRRDLKTSTAKGAKANPSHMSSQRSEGHQAIKRKGFDGHHTHKRVDMRGEQGRSPHPFEHRQQARSAQPPQHSKKARQPSTDTPTNKGESQGKQGRSDIRILSSPAQASRVHKDLPLLPNSGAKGNLLFPQRQALCHQKDLDADRLTRHGSEAKLQQRRPGQSPIAQYGTKVDPESHQRRLGGKKLGSSKEC